MSEPDGKTLIVYSNPDRLEQHLKELSPIVGVASSRNETLRERNEDRQLISDFCAGIRTFIRFDLSLLQQQPKASMQLGDWGKLARKMLPFVCPLAQWGNISAAEFAKKFQDRFLLLSYPYPDRIIVPSQTIDRVWHEHILDTQKYQADCLEVFGYFLHHYGYYQSGEREISDKWFDRRCRSQSSDGVSLAKGIA